jgi:hypothetical protein
MTFDFNISKNYNILRKVADSFPLERNATLSNGVYKNIIQIDNPIGSFYGYKYDGVYTKPEDLLHAMQRVTKLPILTEIPFT